MQLTTFISAAAAIVAAVSATEGRNAVALNENCDKKVAYARVINRCSYPVHLWSVFKGDGCPTTDMVTLKTGEVYNENLLRGNTSTTGVSIKIAKEQQCKGNDIVQLEYYLEEQRDGYKFNYLDVSYVDCLGGKCPTKSEGYYMVAGNQTTGFSSAADNTWCPILSCTDAVSCAKMSYINPDDVQTKTCALDQNMDFYMCGGEAPTGDYDSTPASSAASSSKAAPATSVKDSYNVKAAAVTPAPVKDVEKAHKVKTEVVYVTAYEYVNAKRHAHGHARRHQPFNA